MAAKRQSKKVLEALDHALRQTGKTFSELKNISQNRDRRRDLLLFELQD